MKFTNKKVSCKILTKIPKIKEQNDSQLNSIKKNIKQELNCSDIILLSQIHSNIVIDADFITDFNIRPEADALVSTKANIILGVYTADCVPLLLASSDNDKIIIAAVHCGWRGVKQGIIENILDLMSKKGAHDIEAFIGPAIQQYSYEVDQNYYNNFIKENDDYKICFAASNKENHYFFNLPYLVEMILKKNNVTNIFRSTEDTYSLETKYPSHRRSITKNVPYNTNIISCIFINDL